jgi:hypothetical protein
MINRKDLEGTGHEVIELFSRNLSEKTEENREESIRVANVPAKIPNEHLPSISVDHTVRLETKACIYV